MSALEKMRDRTRGTQSINTVTAGYFRSNNQGAAIDGRISDAIRRILIADSGTELVGKNSDPVFERMESSDAEVLVSAGYDHIIPESTLAAFDRAINLHWSLLPYGRGENPNIWSITEDHPAGVTIHEMVPDIDSGPIITQREVSIEPNEDGKNLYLRLIDEQVDLFASAWPNIRIGKYETSANPVEGGTYHPRSEFRELCELSLDEEMTMGECINILRALTFEPYENAYFEKDGETYYVEIEISPEQEH
ncbi:formyltransferase family protein [Halobacterium salinarum]|uniref:formyltransferase family protein n=1 Tax=Halobacterium salinarum TaxID=2242 RepID=UPI002555DD3E|nr:formyltransferase family protein [Halobacterium salinarum]MDL0120422.1 formyltransferase family protein [Halobacterium salinarum]